MRAVQLVRCSREVLYPPLLLSVRLYIFYFIVILNLVFSASALEGEARPFVFFSVKIPICPRSCCWWQKKSGTCRPSSCVTNIPDVIFRCLHLQRHGWADEDKVPLWLSLSSALFRCGGFMSDSQMLSPATVWAGGVVGHVTRKTRLKLILVFS